jgi:putative transposase
MPDGYRPAMPQVRDMDELFGTHRVRRSNAPHLPDSHQPTRQRERAMKKFTSSGGAQRFLCAFSGISPHFRARRHRLHADEYRRDMAIRFTT